MIVNSLNEEDSTPRPQWKTKAGPARMNVIAEPPYPSEKLKSPLPIRIGSHRYL